MTEPASDQTPVADASHDQHHDPPPFAPIFTLVNNTSTHTTHHPHVRYIFSDDDPDVLTQALADLDPELDQSAADPILPHNRAMILDLAPDPTGGYSVAWASSLSPSWAVLDAQLSQIPQSDEESNNGNEGGEGNGRADRLMLRIEGVDSNALGSEGGISGAGSRQGSGSGSGGGSSQHDRERGETHDYTNLVDKFEKRMTTLRKIVDAGEERRQKMAAAAEAYAAPALPQEALEAPTENTNDNQAP